MPHGQARTVANALNDYCFHSTPITPREYRGPAQRAGTASLPSRRAERGLRLFAVLLAMLLGLSAVAFSDPVDIKLPSQPLSAALREFARQTGIQVAVQTELTKGKISTNLNGRYEPGDALAAMLKGTGLTAYPVNKNTYGIREVGRAPTRNDKAPATSGQGPEGKNSSDSMAATSEGLPAHQEEAIPEILVRSSQSLDTDIRRTEDDPQPYVVFDSQQIQASQAQNLNQFLQSRLPMNAGPGGAVAQTGSSLNLSSINLRGLGPDQTLILVDGRRMPTVSLNGSAVQPDLNGIPLAAIERIEILPSTAGGIYGGSATGGVINVIMKKDFRGLELGVTYGNTFDSDADNTRLDAAGGFSLEGGRTHVMMSASLQRGGQLLLGDRDFTDRSIALATANDPGYWAQSSSPPIGQTVNISSADGSPLVLKPLYGSKPLVSPQTGQPTSYTHLPLGYAGPGSDDGKALLANAGTYNLGIPNDLNGLQQPLFTAPHSDAETLSVRRTFTDFMDAFIDLSRFGNGGVAASDGLPGTVYGLPATAPNNPFQQAINVSFPAVGISADSVSESVTTRATGGLIFRLPFQWGAEADYSWNRSEQDTKSSASALDSAAAGYGTGTLYTGLPSPDGRPALNVLQEQNTYPLNWGPYLMPTPNSFIGPFDTDLKDVTLHLSGPLANLPGGPVNLAILAEHRQETLQAGFITDIDTTTLKPDYYWYPEESQDVTSYYVEATMPLVSAKNAVPGIESLELMTSGRRDEYQTHAVDPDAMGASVPSSTGPFPALTYTTAQFQSTNYTVALSYKPVQDIAFRTSLGTGFLPPTLQQIVPQSIPNTNFSLGTDPKRGGTPMYVVPYTWIVGGNPSLKPEDSRSWSFGTIITPRALPGLRLSIDYTRINKTNEIDTPNAQFLLDNEDLFPGRIVRAPKVPGDPASWAGPIISFNDTALNLSNTQLEAYDIKLDYTLRSAYAGEFHGYILATYQPHLDRQVLPGTPTVDSAGYSDGPLPLRGNFGIDWSRGPYSLGWNAQYYDSYKVYQSTDITPIIQQDLQFQGSAKIRSQMYQDLIGTYRFDSQNTWLGGATHGLVLSAGIQNIFNQVPPIIAAPYVTSGYSAYGDPRLRRYTLSIRKAFGGSSVKP